MSRKVEESKVFFPSSFALKITTWKFMWENEFSRSSTVSRIETRTLTDLEMLEKVFILSNQALHVRLSFYLHARAARHSLRIKKNLLKFPNFDCPEVKNERFFDKRIFTMLFISYEADMNSF